jgi:predicted Zn-dependent protease
MDFMCSLMKKKFDNALKAGVLSIALCLSFPAHSSQLKDQHSVEAVIEALSEPISTEVIKEARDFDDDLMAKGEIDGTKVYLVTDERSIRVNTITKALLEAMGENPSHWVVRVLASDPPVTNAFVTGGKYIYVYTGLISEAASEDELAFVLAHELGHSLLKHGTRARNDISTTVAGISAIAAAFSKNHKDDYLAVAKLATSAYSRVDEEEADAMAVAIIRRAGLDPLRGADFFSRSKHQQDKFQQKNQNTLDVMLFEAQQARANCQQLLQQFNSSSVYKTQENANKVNAVCQDAENKRLQYNQLLQQSYIQDGQRKLDGFFASHPQDQNRVAAIAALNDHLQGRRELQSLDKFQQSYRVMSALQKTNSVLLQKPLQTSISASPKTGDVTSQTPHSELVEQLAQLKRALEQGLITKEEYDNKRQMILSRF